MALHIQELGDYTGKYDVSDSEAHRICAYVDTVAEYEYIWQEKVWWRDKAYPVIDESQWNATWDTIKSKLKRPENHIESEWKKEISEELMALHHDPDDWTHILSPCETATGSPCTVDIPVIWNID